MNYFAQLFEQLGEEDAAEYYRITQRIHQIYEKQMNERDRSNAAVPPYDS